MSFTQVLVVDRMTGIDDLPAAGQLSLVLSATISDGSVESTAQEGASANYDQSGTAAIVWPANDDPETEPAGTWTIVGRTIIGANPRHSSFNAVVPYTGLATLIEGSGAPPSGTGSNGQWYLDTVASKVYGPKSSGSWPGTGTVVANLNVQTIAGVLDLASVVPALPANSLYNYATAAALTAETARAEAAETLLKTVRPQTAVLFGASITQNNGGPGAIANPSGATYSGYYGAGIMTMANALLGQPFDIISNQGIGGQNLVNFLARISTIVALAPTWVFGFDWCANDILQGVSIASMKTTLVQIYEILNAAGITVVDCECPPGTDMNTAAMMSALHTMNQFKRDYAGANPAVKYIDYCHVHVDPTTGFAYTGRTVDGLHPSAAGAFYLGQELARQIGGLVTPMAILPHSSNPLLGGQGAANEIMYNGVFQAPTAGLAADWGVTPISGAAVTTQNIVDPRIPNGRLQQITFTAAGECFIQGVTLPPVYSSTTLWTPGTSTATPIVEVQIDGATPAGGVQSLAMSIQNTSGVAGGNSGLQLGSDTSTFAPPPGGLDLILRGAPGWVIPAGATGLLASVVVTGVVGTIIRLGRFGVYIV